MPFTLTRVAFVSLTLAGCSLPIPDEQDDHFAQQAIDDLRRGDIGALDRISGPEMKTPGALANMQPLRGAFPKGEPLSVKRLAWRANANIRQSPMLVLQEGYDYPDRTLAITVTMSETGSPHEWLVRGLQVNSNLKPSPSQSTGAAKPAAS